MIDTEPFFRQCEVLARCSSTRAVLETAALAVIFLQHSLPADSVRQVQMLPQWSNEELMRDLSLCIFSLAAWMLGRRRPPRHVIHCLDALCRARCLGKALSLVKACKMNRRQMFVKCSPVSGPLQTYRRRRAACLDAYHEYTQDMQAKPGQAIVPDDKCKKFAWVMPRDTYQTLLAYFILLAENWRLTTLSAAMANTLCYELMLSLIPRNLLSFLGVKSNIWFLPYAYAMIKSKCFAETGRLCQTAGHSCVRKVISFASWPKKSCWRLVSRGLQMALQRGPLHWQVWSLKEAPRSLRRQLAGLIKPENPHVCHRCGRAKLHLEAAVHDAGQFFECVTVAQALASAQEVLKLAAERTGCFYACVFRRRKRGGFLSPCSFNFQPRKFRCFTFAELFLVFAAAVSVAHVCVGSHVVQLSTLPIGGLMSMIASALVLCLNEHEWLRKRPVWRAHGFDDTMSWDRQVLAMRYVDDSLQISALYCASCLACIPELVYDVPFKLSESGGVVSWIDMRISLNPFIVDMTQKPIVIQQPWAARQGYVRSWLRGRFARWQQVELTVEQTVAEVTRVFWALLLNGYTFKQLRGITYSFKHERWATEFRILQACFRVAKLSPSLR